MYASKNSLCYFDRFANYWVVDIGNKCLRDHWLLCNIIAVLRISSYCKKYLGLFLYCSLRDSEGVEKLKEMKHTQEYICLHSSEIYCKGYLRTFSQLLCFLCFKTLFCLMNIITFSRHKICYFIFGDGCQFTRYCSRLVKIVVV